MHKIYTIVFFASLALLIISAVAVAIFGLNLGVDFKGGSVFEYSFENERPESQDIKNLLSDTGIGEIGIKMVGDSSIVIRSKELTEPEHRTISTTMTETFVDNGIHEERFSSIGPVIGQELRQKSLRAVIFVLIAISMYIAWVFRKLSKTLSPWAMSIATMAALLHDIIIPLGIFSILGKYLGVEISAVFVAALLTVLGYSVADTVVVFDRIRENIIRGRFVGSPFGYVVHRSVLQTLVRSVNTTMTTLLSLFAIFFFGGESVKYFSLALILGIGLGGYSSLFIASPILVRLSKTRFFARR